MFYCCCCCFASFITRLYQQSRINTSGTWYIAYLSPTSFNGVNYSFPLRLFVRMSVQLSTIFMRLRNNIILLTCLKMHDLAINHKGQKSLAWKENFENNNYAKGTVIFDIECTILLSVCMLCMRSTMMPVTYMGMRRVFAMHTCIWYRLNS